MANSLRNEFDATNEIAAHEEALLLLLPRAARRNYGGQCQRACESRQVPAEEISLLSQCSGVRDDAVPRKYAVPPSERMPNPGKAIATIASASKSGARVL